MMMTVDLISRQSSFNNGLSREVFVTSPLSINTSAVISIRPSRQSVNELNGKSVDNMYFTEIVYSLGSSVATITVLGEYSEIVEQVKGKKRLLNG